MIAAAHQYFWQHFLLGIVLGATLTLSLSCRETAPSARSEQKTCIQCHVVELDRNHQLACTTCHHATDPASTPEQAHQQLLAHPAHPDTAMQTCGTCHAKQTAASLQSNHFTLASYVNLIRTAFGETTAISSLTEIPVAPAAKNLKELGDDMLRRRCLRCHMYSQGENYPSTQHGTGCAACHLSYQNGKLTSHMFLAKPSDMQCLSCHYGNRVGFDYYGRFEHDFGDEFRTPFKRPAKKSQPYGLEYHQLVPDIHQQKGMVCIDCHRGSQLMGSEQHPIATVTCASCHELKNVTLVATTNIQQKGDNFIFTDQAHREHALPLMSHPAHDQFSQKISCQVCHGQWSFIDQGTHLLRFDSTDFDEWENLTSQGSSEVKEFLDKFFRDSNNTDTPVMRDGLSGEQRQGLWLLGYGQRRWENPPLGRDTSGTIQILRPVLDISLSWVNRDREVVYDSARPPAHAKGMVPYTPHTTGKAGIFYEQKISEFLQAEKQSQH